MSASKNLGKVFMTPKGIWDKTLNYTKLDIVTNKVGKISCGYIATTDIEKNIEITDNRWLKLFELLDGDLTEEYKAVQMDVANKATDVDANKKAVDLIYSQMQKLYDVEISTTTPTNERTGLWINPDDISGVINIPEIKDDEVSDVDTWSSKKIDNVTGSLKEDLSNKITKFYASSQGETHLADSDNDKIMDMMVYGKSEQKQYSGKNLFTFSNGSRDINGVIFEAKDGIITAKGTSTKGYTSTYYDFNYLKDIFTIGETYTFSLNSNDANLCLYALYKENDMTDYKPLFSVTTKCAAVKIPDNVDLIIRCVVDIKATVNATATIQIEKGSESTTYEPYTGGIPSPNPDYPQEIKSVVNPTVKVCGKNLLNPTLFKDYLLTMHGVTCKSVTDETGSYFLLEGTADSETDFLIQGNTVFTYDGSADKLTISVREACPDSYYLCVGRLEKDFRNTKAVTTSLKSFSFYIHVLKGAVINNYRIYVQVEVGDIATDYEPYHEQTVTLPYTLNAIPVSSGGNVTIDGQQYIADYVDVERGKLVRMVGNINFDNIRYNSTNNTAYFTPSDLGYELSNNVFTGSYVYNNQAIMFNALLRVNVVLSEMKDGTWKISDMLYIKNSSLGSKAEYLSWFNEIGLIGMIMLAEPEEINLTPEEIAAFKALATYYPTTNIFINSEQLDGYTVFNYPISMENGWNYVKQQIGDTRDYIYDMDARTQDTDLQAAEAYVNSEYAVALTELEV